MQFKKVILLAFYNRLLDDLPEMKDFIYKRVEELRRTK